MKTLIRSLVVLSIIASAPMPSAIAAEEESGPANLKVDLNGDGKPETISWRAIGKDGGNTFHQLLVSDADGKTLWQSPEVREANHPLAFGEYDFGSSLPEFAGDVDRDGTVEMLVPAPQSDVSPTFFRVFHWSGSAFEPKFSRAITGPGRKGALLSWPGIRATANTGCSAGMVRVPMADGSWISWRCQKAIEYSWAPRCSFRRRGSSSCCAGFMRP